MESKIKDRMEYIWDAANNCGCQNNVSDVCDLQNDIDRIAFSNLEEIGMIEDNRLIVEYGLQTFSSQYKKFSHKKHLENYRNDEDLGIRFE